MSKSVSQIDVEIKNANGMHMRPAMQFVDAASQFESDIHVTDGKTGVDGKSIMQMTMLAATIGTKLTIKAHGSDALEAVSTLKELIEEKLFDEV